MENKSNVNDFDFMKGDDNMVRVIDSVMSSGKSTTVKSELEKQYTSGYDGKTLYVCPFLKHIEDELDEDVIGFISDVPSADFKQPIAGYNCETNEIESKLGNLATLILKGKNIATTHSLFKRMTNEIKELLILNEYHIVIDETVDLVEIFTMDIEDYEMLLDREVISYDEIENTVSWNEEREKEYGGGLSYLKSHFKTGTVYLYYDKKSKKAKGDRVYLFAWTFDHDAFRKLKFTILTYLFEGSMMYNYFKMYDIPYKKYTILNGEIVEHALSDESEYKLKVSKLINLYDGKLNDIGEKRSALSKNWFGRNSNLKKQLKNNMVNYRKNIIKAEATDVMWTTFKSVAPTIKGSGISVDTARNKGNFLVCNEIGSNEFGDKSVVIFSCNRYMPVDYKRYFESNGVEVDELTWGLGTLIQWIWRSRIRNGESIDLYIPSKRMRDLFIEWLDG